MPVSVDWVDSQKRIVFMVAKGHLSFDEVVTAANTLRDMSKSAPRPVGVIIDVEPPPFFSRRYGESLREIHREGFPNLEIVVFVSDSIVWEIFQIFARQFGKISYRLAMEPTFEEAVALIRRFQADADMPSASSARWN